MWYSIGFSVISVYKKLMVEPERLIFLFVVTLIVVAFSFILKVYSTIKNEELFHQNLVSGYHKLLITSKNEIENKSLNEVGFNKKQAIFISDILEVKNQYISLKLILNSLKN